MLTFEKIGEKKKQQQQAVESKRERMTRGDAAALLIHPHGSPPKTPVPRHRKDQASKIVL